MAIQFTDFDPCLGQRQPLPSYSIEAAADLATAQVLITALRQRLGEFGQELLDQFESLHRHERFLTEMRTDIDARHDALQHRQAALAVLEELVDARRARLMTEILFIDRLHAAISPMTTSDCSTAATGVSAADDYS